MQTIQKVSEETLKIENIISSSAPGQILSYKELQIQSGVTMDTKGKTYMRTALKRLKMPYETISGSGIRLLSPQNASKIVIHKVIKVDNSIKRAAKTTKQVSERVYNDLTEPEKKNLNFLGALFGTIRGYSTTAKRIFGKQLVRIGDTV